MYFFWFKKKRIGICFLTLVITGLVISIMKKNETIDTLYWLPNNKIIVLDPGHGYPDEGAKGVSGTTENNINLSIAFKVKKLLEQSGNTVILTRLNENGIYDSNSNSIREKKITDIKNRVKIGNESNADIFVSIHLNKIPQEKYWGWQTFFKKNDEKSRELATCIQNGIGSVIKKQNKRVPLKIDNIYIVDHINIPITIVECGFLSNEEEEKLLQTDEYQEKLAQGIYFGICNYFAE